LKTIEICQLAVQKDGTAITHVPDNFISSDLCRQAVESNADAINFDYIPEQYRTEELWRTEISMKGFWFSLLPSSLMSEEFCRIAVANNGLALKNVPDKFITKELCFAAVRQDGRALNYVDVSMLTKEEYTELCRLSLVRK